MPWHSPKMGRGCITNWDWLQSGLRYRRHDGLLQARRKVTPILSPLYALGGLWCGGSFQVLVSSADYTFVAKKSFQKQDAGSIYLPQNGLQYNKEKEERGNNNFIVLCRVSWKIVNILIWPMFLSNAKRVLNRAMGVTDHYSYPFRC